MDFYTNRQINLIENFLLKYSCIRSRNNVATPKSLKEQGSYHLSLAQIYRNTHTHIHIGYTHNSLNQTVYHERCKNNYLMKIRTFYGEVKVPSCKCV